MYQFNKELETGNAQIDSQHKELIQALNNLLDACSKGKGRDHIRQTLVFLQNYTIKHFHDEEVLQKRYQYPDYLNHRRYHATFKQIVQDIADEFEKQGPTIALVGKINAQVGSWIISHIKREDVKVAAHIRSMTK